MTLKQANELNKDILTSKDLCIIYEKYGYFSVICCGKIVGIEPEIPQILERQKKKATAEKQTPHLPKASKATSNHFDACPIIARGAL